MSLVSLRSRLPRDLTWMLCACVALAAAVTAWAPQKGLGLGWDAHAYWLAWQGPMYDSGPATQDAYLYSPAFAQAIWPLAQLPWPVFCAVFVVLPAVAVGWLLAPLGWSWAPALWLACLPEILSGNVYWAIALAAVAGLVVPEAWVLAALTKVTPCLGPIWYLVRGEYRALARSFIAVSLVAGASYLTAPELWQKWVAFLGQHLSDTDSSVGASLFPGPVYRIPVAMALVVWGARTDRRWTLPIAMVLASPVIGLGTFALLSAIPRLQLVDGKMPAAIDGGTDRATRQPRHAN